MTRLLRRRAAAASVVLALAVVGGCKSSRDGSDVPFVQPSSSAAPTVRVEITNEGKFSPGCVRIQPGDTVEWFSRAPELAVNVTSLGPPMELFSPSIQAPLECGSGERTCWRHTFAHAGCFEYFDTNSGSAGRTVVDPYYGTPIVVGQSSDLTTAIVCVDPASCQGVCCDTKFDCSSTAGRTYECVSQRCVDAETMKAVSCPPAADGT